MKKEEMAGKLSMRKKMFSHPEFKKDAGKEEWQREIRKKMK